MPKWAVSPRRVCATVLKFYMGSKLTKILGFQWKKNFGDPPNPPKKSILGGQMPKWAVSPRKVCATVLEFCMSYLTRKWGNLVKSTLQTRVAENFR